MPPQEINLKDFDEFIISQVVLSPSLSVAAVRSCLRSAAMFSVSGEDTRQSKSDRAGLTLRVGRMHQWMCLVKVGKLVNTMAAVYLTAAMESVLEELVAKCIEASKNNYSGGSSDGPVTAILLEQVNLD